jgi:hypothetical protein
MLECHFEMETQGHGQVCSFERRAVCHEFTGDIMIKYHSLLPLFTYGASELLETEWKNKILVSSWREWAANTLLKLMVSLSP